MESGAWYIAGETNYPLSMAARYGDAEHPAHFFAYLGKIL